MPALNDKVMVGHIYHTKNEFDKALKEFYNALIGVIKSSTNGD
jgi:hypothetical protein